MSDKSNTSDSDAGQPVPGTVIHWVWEDSAPVWEAPEKDEISAPSVGPDVPGREVSLLLKVLFKRLLHFFLFRLSSTCTLLILCLGLSTTPLPTG